MRITTSAEFRQTGQLAGLALTAASLLLSGCAFSGHSTGGSGGGTTTQVHLSGSVFGGQQPVVGSTIQLYTVGTTGVASSSTPLLTTPVTSVAGGAFNITGDYTCTSATQVYITATQAMRARATIPRCR
jgi:hypothetical protein